MTELRAQVNVRISPDMNISVTMTQFVDTHEEAQAAGDLGAILMHAYIAGFAAKSGELGEMT